MSVLALVSLLTSIVLMYAAGARMFGSPLRGVLAAGLFAATPLIWRQYQTDPASLYVLPILAGWLAAIALYPTAWPPIAGVILGAGVYTSYSAAVMMPLYAVLTVIVQVRTKSLRQLGVFLAAFTTVASPFVLSLVLNPDRYRAIVRRAHLYDVQRFNVLQGVREMVSWVGLTARSDVYYSYFNPAFLFLIGGVLLWPLLVLIPAGLYRIAMSEKTALPWLSAGGFLVAPFAAALTAEQPVPARILFITPFAALVSVYGVKLLTRRETAGPDAH